MIIIYYNFVVSPVPTNVFISLSVLCHFLSGLSNSPYIPVFNYFQDTGQRMIIKVHIPKTRVVSLYLSRLSVCCLSSLVCSPLSSSLDLPSFSLSSIHHIRLILLARLRECVFKTVGLQSFMIRELLRV
jgi:hypothetical protein